MGHESCLINTPWPNYRKEALEVEQRLIVVQVNGKVRSRIEVPSSYDEKEIEHAALADRKVQKFIGEKRIIKVISVRRKLVNVVV